MGIWTAPVFPRPPTWGRCEYAEGLVGGCSAHSLLTGQGRERAGFWLCSLGSHAGPHAQKGQNVVYALLPPPLNLTIFEQEALPVTCTVPHRSRPGPERRNHHLEPLSWWMHPSSPGCRVSWGCPVPPVLPDRGTLSPLPPVHGTVSKQLGSLPGSLGCQDASPRLTHPGPPWGVAERVQVGVQLCPQRA